MTEPERPAGLPTGSPTPEEISARLEALLKRTHALRAQREPAGTGGALHVAWPPTDGELDRYDVVDVPDDRRAKAASPSAGEAGAASLAAAPLPPREGSEFARPDWSELRLRGGADAPPARSPWLAVLTTLLALVALGQAAYIWHLHTTGLAGTSGQLRVDGPAGAAIRVDGRDIGAAPVDQALDPGEYDVEVEHQGTVLRADKVTVGLGRTVVLLAPTGVPVSTPTTPASPPPTPAPTVPAPSTAALATGAAAVSDTTGAVAIESTPSGLPVTMGGRPRGVTPVTLGLIRPGRHDVLVGGLARQVDIAAGEVTTLRVIR